MRKIGLLGLETVYQCEGFLEGEMGKVFFSSQCVDDQAVQASEFVDFLFAYCFCVGYVGELTYPIGKNGKKVVHYFDGSNAEFVHLYKVFGSDFPKVELRQSGVLVLCESVGKFASYAFCCIAIGINGHGGLLQIVERTDFVQSSHVVSVGMGNKNGIEPRYIFA